MRNFECSCDVPHVVLMSSLSSLHFRNYNFTSMTEIKCSTEQHVSIVSRRILNFKEKRHDLSFFVFPLNPHHPNLPGQHFNVSLVNKRQRSLQPEESYSPRLKKGTCVCVCVHTCVFERENAEGKSALKGARGMGK